MTLQSNQTLLIDGRLRASSTGRTFENVNPFTETIIGTAPDASEEDVDAAIAAATQTRREKLLHIAEGKGIRVRVAYACTAFVAICAVAALLAGDRLAATMLGIEASVLISVVAIAISAARRKALRELQELMT